MQITPSCYSEQARRTVKGTLDEVLSTYDNDNADSTVVDLIATLLTDLLGNNGLGVLSSSVSATYFEHINEESLVPYDTYDDNLEIKSVMWEIPFGEFTRTHTLGSILSYLVSLNYLVA